MFRSMLFGAAAALISTIPTVALAHVTLENKQATVGAGYKAVMRVPHGCAGAATTAIRVRIPDGVVDVKPMPKAGWKLDVVRGKYQKTFNLGGAKMSEGVTELDWTGGKLPDAFYDEFTFTAAMSDDLKAGDKVYFPVVQECEKGVNRWIDIPAEGAHTETGHGEGAATPAPGLTLVPKR